MQISWLDLMNATFIQHNRIQTKCNKLFTFLFQLGQLASLLLTIPAVSAQGAISFSAEVSSDRDYFDGSTVIFDRALSNENGLYAPASGQFLCLDVDIPVFVFIWSLGKASSSGKLLKRFVKVFCYTKLHVFFFFVCHLHVSNQAFCEIIMFVYFASICF